MEIWVPGESNKGAKIIGQELSDEKFALTLEGLSGTEYQFEVLSNFRINAASNGKIIRQKGNAYTISLEIDPSADKYVQKTVILGWQFQNIRIGRIPLS